MVQREVLRLEQSVLRSDFILPEVDEESGQGEE
jgi:hypothetical protein